MSKANDGRIKVGVLVVGLVAALAFALAALAGTWETKSAQAYAGAYLDDDYVAGTIDLASSSAQYTLPGKKGKSAYVVCARGNRAFIECGSDPTVTTSAGGYTFSVPDGACLGPLRLISAKCAHIAATAFGQVEFLHIDSTLR